MKTQQTTTHERYLHAVRDVMIARALERQAISGEQGARLAHTKLLFGVGDGTYRGVTMFDAWENGVGRVDIVEIAATGQESWIQLAGTVIHDPLNALTGGSRAGLTNVLRIRRADGGDPAGVLVRLLPWSSRTADGRQLAGSGRRHG